MSYSICGERWCRKRLAPSKSQSLLMSHTISWVHVVPVAFLKSRPRKIRQFNFPLNQLINWRLDSSWLDSIWLNFPFFFFGQFFKFIDISPVRMMAIGPVRNGFMIGAHFIIKIIFPVKYLINLEKILEILWIYSFFNFPLFFFGQTGLDEDTKQKMKILDWPLLGKVTTQTSVSLMRKFLMTSTSFWNSGVKINPVLRHSINPLMRVGKFFTNDSSVVPGSKRNWPTPLSNRAIANRALNVRVRWAAPAKLYYTPLPFAPGLNQLEPGTFI